MRLFTGMWAPPKALLGAIARAAGLAVIALGARGLAPHRPMLVILALGLAMLVSSSLADARHPIARRIGLAASWAVLSAAAVAPAWHVLITLGASPGAAWPLAVAASVGIGGAYARVIIATRKHGAGTRAAALELASTWLSVSAIVVAFGAQALHAHAALPAGASAAAVLGAAGSLVALVARGGAPRLARAGLAAAALSLTLSRAPALAHGRAPTPVTLTRTLPASCLDPARLDLTFVPLAPLRLLDVEALAARYREALGGAVGVHVGASLPMDDTFVDPDRGQLVAERVLAAVCGARRCPAGEPRHIVIVVTDRDMFMLGKPWRFALATSQGDAAIVSLARMDPAFPLFGSASDDPRRPACDAELRTRAYKMITRLIARDACGGAPSDAPASVLRRSVLSLADLDAIDERVW